MTICNSNENSNTFLSFLCCNALEQLCTNFIENDVARSALIDTKGSFLSVRQLSIYSPFKIRFCQCSFYLILFILKKEEKYIKEVSWNWIKLDNLLSLQTNKEQIWSHYCQINCLFSDNFILYLVLLKNAKSIQFLFQNYVNKKPNE